MRSQTGFTELGKMRTCSRCDALRVVERVNAIDAHPQTERCAPMRLRPWKPLL